MSVPASLALPDGVSAESLGGLAALVAGPDSAGGRGAGGRGAGGRGAAQRGQALLVPGFTGSKEDFLDLLPLLAARGWHVAAVDLPGQLDSPQPEDPGAYATRALGAAVAAAHRALAPGAHLLGHSFGGLVCRAAVLDHGTRPASLVLLGSGPAAIGGPRAAVLPHLRPVLETQGLEAVWEASEAMAAADPRRRDVSAEVHAFLRHRFLAQSPTGLLGMADALLAEPDRVDELASTHLGPLLVAHGAADDAWSPEEQRAMAQRLGAAYEVVPGTVHSPAAEDPAATAALLDRFWGAV